MNLSLKHKPVLTSKRIEAMWGKKKSKLYKQIRCYDFKMVCIKATTRLGKKYNINLKLTLCHGVHVHTGVTQMLAALSSSGQSLERF